MMFKLIVPTSFITASKSENFRSAPQVLMISKIFFGTVGGELQVKYFSSPTMYGDSVSILDSISDVEGIVVWGHAQKRGVM